MYPSYYSHPITKARAMAISGADGFGRAATKERTLLSKDHRAVVVLTRQRFWEAKAGYKTRICRMPDRAGTLVTLG